MSFPLKNALLCIFSILILFVFFLTRSAELLSRNFVFVLDQGRDYVSVSELVDNKKLTLIGSEIGGGYAGINGIFQGPLHYYILSIFYLMFSGDPYGGIVYMFIFAVFTLIASFLFARKIFKDNFVALCVSALFALSPPIIGQAKYLWNPHPVSLFILLTSLFVYLSCKKSKKYLFFAGFFAALTYNFEIATTVPLLIAIFLYSIIILRPKKVKEYAFLTSGVLLGFLPFVIFELRHNFMAINGFLKYITSSGGNSDAKYSLINNHLEKFIYNFGNTFLTPEYILSVIFLLIFSICFFALLLKEKRKELKSFLIFLLILVFSTIFVLSFLRNTVFMYYLYQLNFVYIFFFGYILYASRIQKKIPIFALFIFFLVLFLYQALLTGFKDFKNDYFDYGYYHKIKGQKEAVDYIYKDAKREKFGLFIFAPAIYTYQYDYLFKWYGKNKYGYLPHEEKTGTFYLLAQPDPQKEWSVKGWMETVIKEGKIIDTKTLKSGLIVQKRKSE